MSTHRRGRAVEVFSLSFLDVFACALGILILLMLMLAQQISNATAPAALQQRQQELQAQRAKALAQFSSSADELSDAQKLEEQGARLQADLENQREKKQADEQKLAGLKKEIEANQLTIESLQKARESLAAAQQQYNNSRRQIVEEGADGMPVYRFDSSLGSTTLKVRLFELDRRGLYDFRTKQRVADAEGSEWDALRTELFNRRNEEYPFVVLRPEGFNLLKEFEEPLREAGIPYAIEPYTKQWDKVLSFFRQEGEPAAAPEARP